MTCSRDYRGPSDGVNYPWQLTTDAERAQWLEHPIDLDKSTDDDGPPLCEECGEAHWRFQ